MKKKDTQKDLLLLGAYLRQDVTVQMSLRNWCLSSATLLAGAIVPNMYVMSFSHLCIGFPLLLFPATIPCIIVFSKPLWRVTHCKNVHNYNAVIFTDVDNVLSDWDERDGDPQPEHRQLWQVQLWLHVGVPGEYRRGTPRRWHRHLQRQHGRDAADDRTRPSRQQADVSTRVLSAATDQHHQLQPAAEGKRVKVMCVSVSRSFTLHCGTPWWGNFPPPLLSAFSFSYVLWLQSTDQCVCVVGNFFRCRFQRFLLLILANVPERYGFI